MVCVFEEDIMVGVCCRLDFYGCCFLLFEVLDVVLCFFYIVVVIVFLEFGELLEKLVEDVVGENIEVCCLFRVGLGNYFVSVILVFYL